MPKLVWAGSANIWSFDDKNPLHAIAAKDAAALAKDGDKLALGSYYGLATKVSKRVRQSTGDIDRGMYGSFFGVPANGSATWATHVLYLPEPVMNPVLARLEGDNRVANLIVGWDLVAVKDSKSSAGFRFDITPKFPARVDDPLERVAALAGLTLSGTDQAEAGKQDEAKTGKKK